jgi:CrcB protein
VVATQVGEARLPGGAPTATAAVNVLGAALIGVVAALGNDVAVLVLGVGLLGGFTTFSTWMLEIDEAQRMGHVWQAALLIVVPTALGVVAFAATRSLL